MFNKLSICSSNNTLFFLGFFKFLVSSVSFPLISLVDNLTSELNLNYDTDYILEKMNEVWGFDPREWEGHSCLVQELSVEDCIKEGLAAVDRKEQAKEEKKQEENTNITQLSLF